MANQRQQGQKASTKRAQQKNALPAARLAEAEAALIANDLTKGLAAANVALRAGSDLQTRQRASELVTEFLFRQAAEKAPWERLLLLDQALQHAPHQARLHYHRSLTLWRLGQIDAAGQALRATAENDQSHPDLAYLRELGHVAAGKPFIAQGLSTAQRNTLTLLAQVLAGKADPKALADQPLLGSSALWSALLQIGNGKSAVPATTFADALAGQPALLGNAILSYVKGLLALRQGDTNAALTEWDKVATRLGTPWLVENLRLARRERAIALAQRDDWEGVVTLYEEARRDTKPEAMDSAFGEVAGHAYFHLGFQAAQAQEWPRAYRHFQAADALIKNRLLSQNIALAAEALESWGAAATAWREMVRRRPRKEDHPDYLTDTQVGAIWQRAAHCHLRAEDVEEAITCLKNGLKYTPGDLKTRMTLVQLLMQQDRVDAAENEIDRVLEQDGNYLPALVRKGFLSTNRWDRDPMPIWKRVLAIDPGNEDARKALAELYIQIPENYFLIERYYGSRKQPTEKFVLQILQDGLAAVPNQPDLLLELGRAYLGQGDKARAREYLHQALKAAPTNLEVINIALHELLHVEGDDLVRTFLPQVRQIQGLRPSFWVSQGAQVLHCKLGDEWAKHFWQIAQETAQPRRGEDSPAATLLMIWSAADAEGAPALAKAYAAQLRTNHPQSGALEYIEAMEKYTADQRKVGPVKTLLRKAKSVAEKAGEVAIVHLAEAFEAQLSFSNLFGSFLGGGSKRRRGGNPFADLFGDDDDDDV